MSRLYTEVRGSGPALVLLHGWGLNVRVWDGLSATLCDRFRIIAIDLPGHGRSGWLPARSSLEEQAAQVRETVADIASDYSLLGWSLGGQIALQLAATQFDTAARRDAAAQPVAGAHRGTAARPGAPAQHGTAAQPVAAAQPGTGTAARSASTGAAPDRLVLIATTPRFVAAADWPYGAPPERLAAQAAGLQMDYRRTVSDFLELQVRGSTGSTEALTQLRAALFAHGSADDGSRSESDASREPEGPRLAALMRGLELLHDTDLRPLLPGITVPSLVIAGQYDRVTHPAASRALADSLPDARYVEIRRAAHAPFLSHLAELGAMIPDFLAAT